MPAHPYQRTRGVRWNRTEEQFEMWCPSCATKRNTVTFWPMTQDFWDVEHGLTMCRACRLEKKRADERGRKAAKREELLAANRAYYQENRELLRWKDNQRKVARNEARRLSTQGAQEGLRQAVHPA